MKLSYVKSIVYRLPLEGVVKEGLCFSEPIMSVQDNCIIDNFFTFGFDYEDNKCSGPIAAFGVFADEKKIAYIDTERKKFDGMDCETILRVSNEYALSKEEKLAYEQAYEYVRGILMNETVSEKDVKELNIYYELLKKMHTIEQMKYLRALGTSFFDWCNLILKIQEN